MLVSFFYFREVNLDPSLGQVDAQAIGPDHEIDQGRVTIRALGKNHRGADPGLGTNQEPLRFRLVYKPVFSSMTWHSMSQ